ncbi:MAG: AgmX/PglI C-terminal domain-containing protein [Gammaproteobacteria bacterium]|nr:AgmX/PglI C-terminal domain-containing protein [Gammaproteobacteria bacterium]
MYVRSYDLPWTLADADNRRFNRILLWTLGATMALGILLPVLPVRDKTVLAPPQLPTRMARLLIEPKKKPHEPEVIKPAVVAKPIEKRVVIPVVRAKPAVTPPVVRPVVPPPPAARDIAREKASKAGVMAFADQLADLRQASPDDSLRSRTRVAATGNGAAQRALITTANSTTSAGIDTSAMSRATGGGGLADRQTTRVSTQAPAPARRASKPSASDSLAGARSREEIERVFDKNKAAIYALYRRALRSNPTLQGKVVLTLTIAPSGAVSDVQIVSSELAAPELESRLLRRIAMFDFGARDVAVTTTTKPIDFFPA